MKITHCQMICWAIRHLESEREKAFAKCKKSKEVGAADLQNYFANEAAELNNIIGTLAQLYEIETGKEYGG